MPQESSCGATRLVQPSVSSRNRLRRPSRISASDIIRTAAAASSIPSGRPSSRPQISLTAAASAAVILKSGRASRARSTKSSIASSASDSGGTRQISSPGTPIGARLVARIVSRGHAPSRSPVSTAHASTRCSQLSSTRSTSRSPTNRASVSDRGTARLVRQAERAQHRYRHHLWIGHRREIHKPCPTAELGRRLCGDLHRQPRLTDTARAGQGHQPVFGQELAHVVDLRGATDETRQLHRKSVRCNVIGPCKRRELDPQVGMAQLRHAFGAGQIAEPMGAQVGQPDVGRELIDDQIVRGARQHDLAAVRQIA